MENTVYFGMSEAVIALPKRHKEANKGSFGKALVIAGSRQYMGAGHLALEAALRGGAGYVGYLNESRICDVALLKYPEAIYHKIPLSDIEAVLSVASGYTSVLIGPGLGCSESIARLTESLVKQAGGVLVIDADALNSISRYSSVKILKKSSCDIIITPHPLELSRLTGLAIEEINSDRVNVAGAFAREYGATLLLKGNGTVVSDGSRIFVNTSGNTALSKGGTGDVLAGLIVSLSAFMPDKTLAAILSAFIHGLAAERESEALSEFGVLPSDLPCRMAEAISSVEKTKKV